MLAKLLTFKKFISEKAQRLKNKTQLFREGPKDPSISSLIQEISDLKYEIKGLRRDVNSLETRIIYMPNSTSQQPSATVKFKKNLGYLQ